MIPSEPNKDTGLAGMLASVREGEFGVIADWIEEQLQLDDLATVLRQAKDDPRAQAELNRTAFQGFRYRIFDPYVMVYMAKYHIWQPIKKGKTPRPDNGHVIGFILSSEAPKGAKRVVRWIPEGDESSASKTLWTELGDTRPEDTHLSG